MTESNMFGWINKWLVEIMMIKNACRYIEGDFDAYVKRIQQPFVWGGEPELLMASHVLK